MLIPPSVSSQLLKMSDFFIYRHRPRAGPRHKICKKYDHSSDFTEILYEKSQQPSRKKAKKSFEKLCREKKKRRPRDLHSKFSVLYKKAEVFDFLHFEIELFFRALGPRSVGIFILLQVSAAQFFLKEKGSK